MTRLRYTDSNPPGTAVQFRQPEYKGPWIKGTINRVLVEGWIEVLDTRTGELTVHNTGNLKVYPLQEDQP